MGVEASLADGLADALEQRPTSDGAEVVAWRFSLSEGWSLRAGLKDGRLGGPYEPPTASCGVSGSIYLHWADDLVSRGDLDAYALQDFAERLADWRAHAYGDPCAPDIPEPQALPTVRTADPAVEIQVAGEPQPLVERLLRARTRLSAIRLSHIRAESAAAYGWRYVYNSRGLRVAFAETFNAFSVSAEDLYRRSLSRRRRLTDDEIDELLEDVASTTSAILVESHPPTGRQPVLLTPSVAASMLSTFLLANLDGSHVVNGRSAYSLDDFRSRRQVLRPDISLVVDSLLDDEGAASPISAEGVPGGRTELIASGHLVTPRLDLKHATLAGLAPTPVPGGAPPFLLRSERPLRLLSQVQAALEDSLQVHSVLGLHSQDATAGRYSLIAPAAMVLHGAKPLGRAKVALSGNFLEHLLDEQTEFVAFPWGLTPGLLIWATVGRRV